MSFPVLFYTFRSGTVGLSLPSFKTLRKLAVNQENFGTTAGNLGELELFFSNHCLPTIGSGFE